MDDFSEIPTGLIFIWLLVWVLFVAAMWKVFVKAGRPGWEAIIPIYNVYMMLKIGGKPGWWLLLFIVPVANVIVAIWSLNMISKSFGKDEGFTAGLLFLGFIFWPVLGFGPAQYQGPYGDPVAYAEYQKRNQFEFEEQQ